MVLLHGIGTSALEWRRTMPGPGAGPLGVRPRCAESRLGTDGDYSPASLAGFVARFFDAVGVGRAAVAGNSLGGLLALRLALADPGRVSALILSDSAGRGREITPVQASTTLPGYGEAAVSLVETPMGAVQRV